jgi:ParB family transcriptional regulator, chromosome partitioning protein
MARQTLGRGLSALLGEEKPSVAESNSIELDIDLIDPNPAQPRTSFDEAALDELSRSIRANGVVQPIVVRRAGSRYQIVAGERRWRASQRAELRRIPAVIKDVPDEKLLELALVENIQRQELNPIEEAKAYRKLIENIGLTQERVAEQLGKDRTVITTSLRLLRLPTPVQQMIEDGRLSAGHGRALLMVQSPEEQIQVARQACESNLSVRETERVAKGVGRSSSGSRSEPGRAADPNIRAAETRLMRALNTNVRIVPARGGSGGKIEVEYYSLDDLERIYEVVTKARQ